MVLGNDADLVPSVTLSLSVNYVGGARGKARKFLAANGGTPEDFAKKLDTPKIKVRAAAVVSAKAHDAKELVAVTATRKAYEIAGIGPEDLDVVELHDATAPAELIHYENIGLCAPGDAVKLLRSGDTAVGGRLNAALWA